MQNSWSKKFQYMAHLYPEWKIFGVFLLFFLLAGFTVPHFLETKNLLAILVQMAPIGIVAIGMTFVIISSGVDLSVGSMVAMCSVLMVGDGSNPTGIMCMLSLVVGGLTGAFNGALIGYGRLSPFIVTLSSMAITKGVALWYSQTEEIVIRDTSFSFLGSGTLLGLPFPVWPFIVLTFLGQFLLRRTVFGKYVCAIGSNPTVSSELGIQNDRILLYVYSLTGVLTGLAALIISSRLNISTPTVGEFYELDAIAAVIIGGTMLSGGSGSVWGTFFGTLIFGIITNVLNLSGTSPHMQRIAKGVIILLAVIFQSAHSLEKLNQKFKFFRKTPVGPPRNPKDLSKVSPL